MYVNVCTYMYDASSLDIAFFIKKTCTLLENTDQGQNSTLRSSGGRISVASPPGNIDVAIAMRKDNPGPGKYRVEDVDMNNHNLKYSGCTAFVGGSED